MGGKHNKCCCGKRCEGITGLFGTGVEHDASNPCATSPGIDSHWTADGGSAYVFTIGNGSPPEDPTNLLGCGWEVPAITKVCAADIVDKAVVEPGGPDGVETVFRLEFEIASGTNLDAIAFCGTYAADNYVKAGKWLVNDVDQAHIPHGAYDDPPATPGVDGGIPCRDFAFTNDTAPLVHGTNVIEITAKNGWIGSAANYGGPHFLQLTIDCVDRYPCSGVCKQWTAIEGDTEPVEWAETTTGECPCYCEECPDFPPYEPTEIGETYTANCSEIVTPLSALASAPADRAARVARVQAATAAHYRLLGWLHFYRRPGEGLGDAALRLRKDARKTYRKHELSSRLTRLLKRYACDEAKAVSILNSIN